MPIQFSMANSLQHHYNKCHGESKHSLPQAMDIMVEVQSSACSAHTEKCTCVPKLLMRWNLCHRSASGENVGFCLPCYQNCGRWFKSSPRKVILLTTWNRIPHLETLTEDIFSQTQPCCTPRVFSNAAKCSGLAWISRAEGGWARWHAPGNITFLLARQIAQCGLKRHIVFSYHFQEHITIVTMLQA